MLTKIYLGMLAVAICLTSFFTYYSWSWLQSIGRPAVAVEGYTYHDNLGWYVMIVSSVILLIAANSIMWTTRNGWALWATFGYFAVFTLIRYFWLDQALFQFKKLNGLSDGSFSIGPLFGVVLVLAAGVFVFFDQFAMIRLHRKMYPPVIEPETPTTNDGPDPE